MLAIVARELAREEGNREKWQGKRDHLTGNWSCCTLYMYSVQCRYAFKFDWIHPSRLTANWWTSCGPFWLTVRCGRTIFYLRCARWRSNWECTSTRWRRLTALWRPRDGSKSLAGVVRGYWPVKRPKRTRPVSMNSATGCGGW